MKAPVPEPFILLAVDPALQGVYMWGSPDAGPPLPVLARGLTGRPPVRVPARLSPDQLADPLDVQATLAQGRPVHRPGVVRRARHGALVLEAADLMPVATAARLAGMIRSQPLCQRPLLLVRASTPPRPSDPIAAHCALWLPCPPAADLGLQALPATGWDEGRQRVAAAREQLHRIPLPPAVVEEICRRVGAAAQWGQSLDYFVARAARARAAWHGRTAIGLEDIEAAVGWVVAPRAARPDDGPPAGTRDGGAGTQDPEPSPGPAPPPAAGRRGAHPSGPARLSPPPPPPAWDTPQRAAAGLRVGAGQPGAPVHGSAGAGAPQLDPPPVMVVPPAALAGALSLAAAGAAPPRSGAARRAGTGRPGTRPTPHRASAGLALAATLLAAAPYQRLRPPRRPLAVRVLPGDLRWRRPRPQPRSLYILAVDGSGSMAQGRMQLAKGAALSVLQGAYQERRYVALIDFRQRAARLLCPPGRSPALIRRQISALPSGGGTPLPAALALALRMAERWRRRHPDSRCTLVLFTDGKANVPLLEESGPPPGKGTPAGPPPNDAAGTDQRARAWADVERLGALLRGAGVGCVLVDTSPPGTALALGALARCLGAGILRLSHRRG
ncbi:MAG TPA: VWA domain-containing protein [Limnochordales bacterium]|nr:VWA domain-containing protein [Limnochordales bacterium]